MVERQAGDNIAPALAVRLLRLAVWPDTPRRVMSHDPAGSLLTVLVASTEVLAAWSERANVSNEIIALNEADTQGILDVVTRRRPQVVVLERRFLSTSKGAALVHRLRNDDELPRVEIRVLPTEHAVTLMSAHTPFANSPAAVAALAQPLAGSVRRAVRVSPPEGVSAQINGVPAALVDLSTLGVQVVSPRTLRPNQYVRIQLADEQGVVVRARAGVAWSAFELPPGGPPRYRAGMEFRDTDPHAIESFFSRLASSASGRRDTP
jgi:hypothetical protein